MPELSIRKIIEKTLSGEIRIPSFQRGFVWEPEKVAFFIDSLYKGYPIGSLLFWRTNIRLENERQLGNYSLPEPTKGYLHIFAAAPNAFMFHLGQVSRPFGKCILYEYDFEQRGNCSYIPSIQFDGKGGLE